MNDLLNDINNLKAIQENVASLNGMDFTKKIISDMIKEKLDIVSDFEKQNMPFAEYSEYMKGVGFNA
jgi:hypothetical protein